MSVSPDTNLLRINLQRTALAGRC